MNTPTLHGLPIVFTDREPTYIGRVRRRFVGGALNDCWEEMWKYTKVLIVQVQLEDGGEVLHYYQLNGNVMRYMGTREEDLQPEGARIP